MFQANYFGHKKLVLIFQVTVIKTQCTPNETSGKLNSTLQHQQQQQQQVTTASVNYRGTKNPSPSSYAVEAWDLSSQLRVPLSSELDGTDRSKLMIIRECPFPAVITDLHIRIIFRSRSSSSCLLVGRHSPTLFIKLFGILQGQCV